MCPRPSPPVAVAAADPPDPRPCCRRCRRASHRHHPWRQKKQRTACSPNGRACGLPSRCRSRHCRCPLHVLGLICPRCRQHRHPVQPRSRPTHLMQTAGRVRPPLLRERCLAQIPVGALLQPLPMPLLHLHPALSLPQPLLPPPLQARSRRPPPCRRRPSLRPLAALADAQRQPMCLRRSRRHDPACPRDLQAGHHPVLGRCR